eukprot:233889-Amphidinium_carterae.1
MVKFLPSPSTLAPQSWGFVLPRALDRWPTGVISLATTGISSTFSAGFSQLYCTTTKTNL